MNRRSLLSTTAVGIACGLGGCVSGGGEVVKTVQRDVAVQPGDGWVIDVPDVSDPGGAIRYRTTADRPFDVYFFSNEESYMFYDTFTDGNEPAMTPAGNSDVGTSAQEVGDDTYRAETQNGGARQPIDASGPYFFVVDNSEYREETPPKGDPPSPLEVYVDLTVTQRKLI